MIKQKHVTRVTYLLYLQNKKKTLQGEAWTILDF